jgi:DNA-binding transcriptional regulator YbjK
MCDVPRGVVDPTRRERIARAAIEVVARDGHKGLTHRAAAAAADVPLGSTTYHFRTLDDLLAAAVEAAKATWDESLSSWEARLPAEPDLAGALADLLVETTRVNRERSIVEYELYVAALRRENLRELSFEWDEALPSTLARHTDPVTAQALALAFDGMVLKSLIRGTPLTIARTEPILRRIIA